MAGTIKDRFKQIQANRLSKQKGITFEEAWRELFEPHKTEKKEKGATNTDVIKTLTQALDRMSRAMAVPPPGASAESAAPPPPPEEKRVSFDNLDDIVDGLSKGEL
ncbi:MAG: hypothetical protein HY608_07975 [Planctomycetes bacterium]|nr:hypothetical protein [Planctomycetota bacterium]